jgi:hypothetical protein
MNFKKGDIIYNGSDCGESLQWVKLLSDLKCNSHRTGDDCGFRSEYPYLAKVIHVKGKYVGEIVDGYFISRDSILIRNSDELFNRKIKPFKFCK